MSPMSRTRSRRSIGTGVALAALMTMLAGGPAVAGEPCWNPPVGGRIVDPFRMPGCTWCPGNRGIEYEVAPATLVRSVAAGTVEFSGVVAGERYVVVRLPTGWQLTYGRISRSNVDLGHAVLAGTVIGVADATFLFGLRVDGDYSDPAPYLGTPAGRRRLVPIDGRPARPAPAAAPQCDRTP